MGELMMTERVIESNLCIL